MAAPGFLGAYRYWRLPRKKELGTIVTVAVIVLLWAFAGIHASQTPGIIHYSPSQFYLNPDVNLVEILSWVCPAVVLIV